MHVNELKPGTYFKSDGTSFLFDRAQHIRRCWDGAFAEAGFRAYPNTSVEVISTELAHALARDDLHNALLG